MRISFPIFRNVSIITLMIMGIPFILNYASNAINWDVLDYVIAFSLVFSVLMTIVLINQSDRFNKPFWFLTVILFFLLIYIELAVGLISNLKIF